MPFLSRHRTWFQKLALLVLTVSLVVGGTLWQSNVLKVQAAVQVLLVSKTAIAFGNVFPGETPSETYTVALDTSANSATYVTTLTPLPNVQNLCPYLTITSIDSPPEPDTLADATLTRPGDILDKWQVSFQVPGFSGQLSQDATGGIIVVGGNYGCKITITTTEDPGTIIICKQSVNGTGTFSYGGDLGEFSIDTGGQGGGNYNDKNNNNDGDCGQCPSGGSQGGGNNYGNSVTPDGKNNGGGNNNNGGCGNPCTTNGNGNGNGYDNSVTANNSNGNKGGGDNNGGCNNDGGDNWNSGGSNGNSQGGTGEKVFSDLTPGNYSVSEFSQSGWDLTSLTCSDPTKNSSISQNIANIKLDSGETVKCTFVNTKEKGTIVIVKKTVGGDGKFNFSGDLGNFNIQTSGGSGSQTFTKLAAGTYNVSESSQSGWKLTSLVCVDPSSNTTTYNNSAKIKLALGETVTCTFTNTKNLPGKIVIVKKTVGGDGKFYFNGDLGSFNIQTSNSSGSQTFSNLTSGTYDVSESSQSGWKLTSLSCSDGSSTYNGTAKINLSPGETVTCTFTNTKKGKIIIIKHSPNDNDGCGFSGDFGNFSVQTQGGSGSKEFDDVDSGTYHVTESSNGKWSPQSVVCTGGNGNYSGKNSANINVGPGQTVSCTFVDGQSK